MRQFIPDSFFRLGKRFYSDDSLRSVMMLSSGSIAGQIILVAASPFIARLYTPGEYGAFAIFFSVFGVVAVLATLQFQNAIPLPSDDRDGARLLIASFAVLSLFTVLLWGLIGFLGDSTVLFGYFGEDSKIIRFLPAAIAAASANLCLQFWFLRKKEYKSLAIIKSVQSVTMAGGQIIMGLAHWGAVGLIAGHILGQASGIFFLARKMLPRHKAAFLDLDTSSVWKIAWQNRSFATTFTPSALLSAGTIYLPAIMLGILFGPAVAGVFTFALQVLKAGVNIVVLAVSKVFLVNSIEDFRKGHHAAVKKRAIRISLTHFLISAPFFLLLTVYGKSIFDFVFGSNWTMGGTYAALLTPHLITLFVFEHMTSIFVVTGAHKAKLIWEVGKFLVLPLAFVAAKMQNLNAEDTILILSAGWGLLHILLIPITFRSLKGHRAEVKRAE